MLSNRDKEIVRVLQEGIPLVSRPYQALAGQLDMSEDELLETIETRQSIDVRALWYEGEQYLGLVELAIELPKEVPHFLR